MSELALRELFALNLARPVEEAWEGFSVMELTGQAVYWLGVHQSGMASLEKCCVRTLGSGLPDHGRFVTASLNKTSCQFAWAGRQQWLIRGKGIGFPADLAKCGTIVDQSDGWVGFELSGGQCREVLARLCPLDLDAGVFPAGQCARVPLEGLAGHLSCLDPGAPRYELLIQRSSARSLLDHMRHAAHNLCGRRINDPNKDRD